MSCPPSPSGSAVALRRTPFADTAGGHCQVGSHCQAGSHDCPDFPERLRRGLGGAVEHSPAGDDQHRGLAVVSCGKLHDYAP